MIERLSIAVQRWWWWHAHGALWGVTTSAQRGGLYRVSDGGFTNAMLLTADFVRDHPRVRYWPNRPHTPTPYAEKTWPSIFRDDG